MLSPDLIEECEAITDRSGMVYLGNRLYIKINSNIGIKQAWGRLCLNDFEFLGCAQKARQRLYAAIDVEPRIIVLDMTSYEYQEGFIFKDKQPVSNPVFVYLTEQLLERLDSVSIWRSPGAMTISPHDVGVNMEIKLVPDGLSLNIPRKGLTQYQFANPKCIPAIVKAVCGACY